MKPKIGLLEVSAKMQLNRAKKFTKILTNPKFPRQLLINSLHQASLKKRVVFPIQDDGVLLGKWGQG